MEEACVALRESQLDEDITLDLFYQGNIVIEKGGREVEQPKDNVEPAQKEEFPTLSQSSTSVDASVRCPEVTAWCQKQVKQTRSLHGSACRVMLDTEDADAFPSLPIPKVSTLASQKCNAKEAEKRRCRSSRTNTCPVTEVPRWKRYLRT
jgi:hypothetical protein